MPELVTSVIAVRRKQPDVAVANMIGSNIFNILGILGITALVKPIVVPAQIMGADMVWLVGTALLLYPILLHGSRVRRREGALLTGLYIIYLITILR